MFDSFPYDEWSEDVADFWTCGGAQLDRHVHPDRARVHPDGRVAHRLGRAGEPQARAQAAALRGVRRARPPAPTATGRPRARRGGDDGRASRSTSRRCRRRTRGVAPFMLVALARLHRRSSSIILRHGSRGAVHRAVGVGSLQREVEALPPLRDLQPEAGRRPALRRRLGTARAARRAREVEHPALKGSTFRVLPDLHRTASRLAERAPRVARARRLGAAARGGSSVEIRDREAAHPRMSRARSPARRSRDDLRPGRPDEHPSRVQRHRRLEPSARACRRSSRSLYEAKLVVTSVTPVLVGAAPEHGPGPELHARRRAPTRARDRGRARRGDRRDRGGHRRGRREPERGTDRRRHARAEPGRAHARAQRVGERAADGPLRRADRALSDAARELAAVARTS